jgi:hypothetical protein
MRGALMESLLESAATKAGVPSQVLDLLDRSWISQLVDEFPSLLLPPIMETLHREYVRHGLEWMKQNVDSLKKQFLLMKQLYGPTWILA